MADDEVIDFSNDTLNNWLLNHQNMIKYVQLTSVIRPNSKDQYDTLLDAINRIENMIEKTIIPNKPEEPYIHAICNGLSDESTRYAHIHFYLQNKIFTERTKTYTEIVKAMSELLSAIREISNKTNNLFIHINENSIYWQLLNDARKILQLSSKDADLISKITSLEPTTTDVSSQKSILRNVVFSMKNIFDRNKYSIIPENPYQERLNQLLFSYNFIFADDVKSILDPNNFINPQLFTDSIVRLVDKIVEEFEITDENDKNIILWTSFRSFFNACIPLKSEFFFASEEPLFRLRSPYITIDDIAVKKEFLPPHEEGDSAAKIVASNKKLSDAAEKINTSAYMTTPFDIMDRIYAALSEIKTYAVEAATEKNKDDAYTFDCVFGLFLLVLISCDLPNVEEVFTFSQNFAPISSLTSQLQYAHMTISAALLQTKKLTNVSA